MTTTENFVINPKYEEKASYLFSSLARQLSFQAHRYGLDYALYHPMVGLMSQSLNGLVRTCYAKKACAFLPIQLQIRVNDEDDFRLKSHLLLKILAMHLDDKKELYEEWERSGIALMVSNRSGERLAVWRWCPSNGWEMPSVSGISVAEFAHALGKTAENPVITSCRACWALLM